MNLDRLMKVALISAVLLGGSAAFAADAQADGTTTLKVKLALLNKLGADSLHVDVDSVGGAVNLKGTVSKRETKELAETVAKSVTGVTTVDNDVEVAANVANPNKAGVAAGEAEAELKDVILETKIRIALVDKMGSDGFKIGTDAASGVVTLEFEKAFTAAQRSEASKVVQGVEGVSKVVAVDKKA
jgi:osmotically-inducible protein OsmY